MGSPWHIKNKISKGALNVKYEQEVKDILISNTITLIARGGFESATTKAITHSGNNPNNIKMNEVYIYRLFGSKEHLYSVAFSVLDQEIFRSLRSAVHFDGAEQDIKGALYEIFLRAWRFVLGNEDRCMCYMRYYYSIYFRDESLKDHNELFAGISGEFAPLFKEDADVKSIMHSVFTAILDFAVRVYHGDLENTPQNTEHIFNVIYCMMASYLKNQTVNQSVTAQSI